MNKPLVNIHSNARLHASVQVESFTTIYDDVEIGEGTWIGPNVTIMSGVRIGKNCKIFPGAVLGAEPQDLKFGGEYSEVFIGDNTTIRECVTVHRGTVDRKKTVVGSHTLLMAYVHIAHDCIIGDHCVIANSSQIAGHVEVQDYAIIGGTSALHQFVRIGAHSILAGGSLVNKDVPPFVKAARYPSTYSGINTIGLKRRGFSVEDIDEIQEIYRVIYLKGNNNSDAVAQLEKSVSLRGREIASFIKNSKMGIIKGPSSRS